MGKMKNKGLHKTLVLEWITIVGAVLTCFGILYAEIKGLDSKIDRQGQRTDRLYEMFIDLIKQTKCEKI